MYDQKTGEGKRIKWLRRSFFVKEATTLEA
jgi:hypothetical protein